MNIESGLFWLAIAIQFGLGVAVYRANPKNYGNQSFFVASLIISAWLFSLEQAFSATSEQQAAQWIRHASASGVLIVCGFNLLRLSILCREGGWPEILKRSLLLVAISVPVIGLCYTPAFLLGATLRNSDALNALVPRPTYGVLAPIYFAFLAVAVGVVLVFYIRGIRSSGGMRKVELQFVVAGQAAIVAVSLAGLLMQPFLPRAAIVRFAPFRIVVFSVVIAYGIATRKILEVGFFLRRVIAYSLLVAYLLALYAFVFWLFITALVPFLAEARGVAHIAAAVIIAFAMAPARGISQSLADRLFVGTRRLDFRSTMSEAATILQSVTTLQDLLDRFAQTIAHAVNTDSVFILLADRQGFTQRYPDSAPASPLLLTVDQATISYLEKYREPIVVDELHRMRPTPELDRVRRQMESLGAAVAMGIFSREQLAGVMLLGPRQSGRIYGGVEQSALQVLCGQLAIAVQNAQLFTEVQNAKIYNDILVQNLTTGVIAADADGEITVFNHEAELITGLAAQEMLGVQLTQLPRTLRTLLQETLGARERQEDREIGLETGGETHTVVRASSSIFRGQDGQLLGALVVLTDVTALKRLELQIRRSDRLASLGTLSAGMAHEIKNPLVSIKTFTQLLPERYHDSDFRETFSNLIGHEIDRIDSLVNQLLRFARPAKPLLNFMHVHDVLEKSLILVGHRLYQKDIRLVRKWDADVDTIRADADQLEQVFLNFFLNAMDAMKPGGELTVQTEILGADIWTAEIAAIASEGRETLRVTIQDNGEGIRAEDLSHVFDPFFTTKDYGTGLGLSVVHGIIQEHGGHIEVESELSKGTAFHILLPLYRLDRDAAAA